MLTLSSCSVSLHEMFVEKELKAWALGVFGRLGGDLTNTDESLAGLNELLLVQTRLDVADEPLDRDLTFRVVLRTQRFRDRSCRPLLTRFELMPLPRISVLKALAEQPIAKCRRVLVVTRVSPVAAPQVGDELSRDDLTTLFHDLVSGAPQGPGLLNLLNIHTYG